MWDAELETAHRLAMRGAALIERQRAMIDDLRVYGHNDLAEKSEEILHALLVIQAERIVIFHKLMARRRTGA